MNEEIIEKIENTNKNLIVSGDLGSGKTTNVLFPLVDKIIEKKESFFISSKKEEYINQYYSSLKEKGYHVIILNLQDVKKSFGWNPLTYPYELYKQGEIDKSLERLEEVGKELFYENGEVDPFWTSSASDLFTGIALGLYEDAKGEEINLLSVNHLLNANTIKIGGSTDLIDYFKGKSTTGIAYNLVSLSLFAPKDTRDSIVAVAKQKLSPFVNRELLSKMLSKTTFSYDNILEKPTAIFFVLSENQSLNQLASLFIDQMFSFLKEKKKENFHFVLDDFDWMSHVLNLKSKLSLTAPWKMPFIFVTRSSDNLKEKYSRDITSLAQEITVNEKEIKVNISGEETIFKKELRKIELEEVSITCPDLEDVKIFDYKSFLKRDEYSKLNVEEILEHLDAKIALVEEEEQVALKVMAFIQEMKEGEKHSISELVKRIDEKKTFEEDSLKRIYEKVLNQAEEEDIVLDYRKYDDRYGGLPWDLEFTKRKKN